MKTVITGITSFRNHGVEALVTTTIEQLKVRFPASTYQVFDRQTEYDALRMKDKDINFHHDNTARPLFRGKIREILTNLSNYCESIDREYQKTLKILRGAGMVVASGGDIFSSDYGTRSLLSHLRPLELALDQGVPVFFHAQSIGPFKNDRDRDAFVKIGQQAAAITVREKLSYHYVVDKLKLSTEKVIHTADPAFLLRKPPEEILTNLKNYFFREERPTVAISTSQAICNWSNVDYDLHFNIWCKVVEMILNDFQANVIIIPHVQEISVKNDDRILATDLIRHFKFDHRIRLAGGDYTASEFKGIIGCCQMLIAERMHAAIAGLSHAICTVVIGYSIKAEGIVTDLIDRETVKDCLLIPLNDFLDWSTASTKIGKAWNQKDLIKQKLQQALPEVQRRAHKNFDIIKEMIGSG